MRGLVMDRHKSRQAAFFDQRHADGRAEAQTLKEQDDIFAMSGSNVAASGISRQHSLYPSVPL
jgi:hypothetical protein